VADFGLLGPMLGHLNRDPWPKREWLDPRPNLQKWVEKMARGDKAVGELLANDQIPTTLMPVINIILAEYLPMMQKTAQEITGLVKTEQLKSGDALPRSTAHISFTMLNGEYKRASFTYSVWRMQRVQKMVEEYSHADKQQLNGWLSELGQADFLKLELGHDLKRHGLMAALA